MKRREFIGLVGGAVVAWPVGAQGQQVGQKRRVGVLMGYAENNRGAQIRFDALKQGLAALGWIEDHNIIIDVRWSAGSTERATVFAKEL